jgi:hypothetical protein
VAIYFDPGLRWYADWLQEHLPGEEVEWLERTYDG